MRGLACLMAVVGVLCGPAVRAGDVTDALRFSGFGTVAGILMDSREVYFTRASGINQPGGGYLDFGPDSILGVQGSYNLGLPTELTVQITATEDELGRYTPKVSWAFLKHAFSPEISLRVGRLRVPFFMLSDSVGVNFANPWVRPPPEVYGLNPFNDLNGADVLYQTDMAGVALELRPYFGTGQVRFPFGYAKVTGVRGLNLAVHLNQLSLYGGHGETPFSLKWGDPLFVATAGALEAVGMGQVVRDLRGDRGYVRFDSLGFQHDNGSLMVAGEYVQRRANRYITSNHAWFVSAAYRFGNVSPYLTIARQTADDPITEARVPVPAVDDLVQLFQASRSAAQHSTTLGMRWDWSRSAAFKAELSRIKVAPDAWGSLFPADELNPLSPLGQRIHMLSLSMDFVF